MVQVSTFVRQFTHHLLRKMHLCEVMDCRVISAFTRVFNALCPAMTTFQIIGLFNCHSSRF
jgi:hypothetical protein